ncbi:MAG: L-threonylcarbamoyladenylate synthase [bacterium]
MKTMKILNIDGDSIPNFEKIGIIVPLDKGELFVIPTDTHWGLCVSPNFPKSIKRVFDIKHRPLNLPLPLFPANLEKAVELLGKKPGILFRKLSEKFWPGALTIIDKSERIFNSGLTSDGNKIGLRIPDHPLTQEIIDTCREGYLAVTSVNRHGEPALNSIDEIRNEFDEEIHILINNNRKMKMQPSTVVDISTGKIKCVREGVIPLSEIMSVVSS